MTPPIRRRFLQVGARRVHYLRSGEGPPVVLIHSSPANAWFLRPEIEHLSSTYTVFAFDTPGFGLSQPLPLTEMTVADLADAMAQTLATIGMPPCPVYGSHSGAAIALELGVRHPDRVTGLVLDGVPAFTDEECAALFGDYFRKLPVTDLGGQYSEIWTRFRDQSTWFPWGLRNPENLNAYDLSPPESTHLWASMYFDAADTYTPAYRATSHYGLRAVAAVAELDRPAIFTATTTDMLYPHMARFPALKPGQEIREIGTSLAAKHALTAEGFARFGGSDEAPADRDAFASTAELSRQFIDGADGGQVHLRYAGDRGASAVLLLHDAPGSVAALEDMVLTLAADHFVIAPDLPGHGESDAFPSEGATIERFAKAAAHVVAAVGLTQVRVVGFGFGSSVGVAMAAALPDVVSGLVLAGLLAGTSQDRARLAADYTPPIPIMADGSHWYRTWLMLRDSLIWWPWFQRTKESQRKTVQDFGGDRLHRWTLDVMRRRETYGLLVQAALVHDATAALYDLVMPVCRITGADTPLAAFDQEHSASLTHTLTHSAAGNVSDAVASALRSLPS